MGLTTTLYTALTGMTTNATLLSVAGNNIANVNTTGFKASRMTFETQISQNLGPASSPTDKKRAVTRAISPAPQVGELRDTPKARYGVKRSHGAKRYPR